MRRILTFVLGWSLAAGGAFFVARQGVGVVSDQVTSERPAPLTAADVQALLVNGDRGEAPVGEEPTVVTFDDIHFATTSLVAEARGSTSLPESDEPVVESEASGATPTSAPSPSPSPSPSAPAPTETAPTNAAPSVTTTAAPAPAETRTYAVAGGSAAIRFSPEGVIVEWATPASGFELDIDQKGAHSVTVEFEGDDTKHRIDGWWDDGPRDRVRSDD